MSTTTKKYVAQLQQMYKNGQDWRKANPGREVLISWGGPPQVAIVGAISDAVKAGVVRANPAGMELLKALWTWDDETEPTVIMCRAVLELEKETQLLKQ